jgi:hypothetical protein
MTCRAKSSWGAWKKLEEMWRDFDENRFDCKAWWEEARREYAAGTRAKESRPVKGG